MVWLWVLKILVIGIISVWLGSFIEDALNQALLPLITSPVPHEIISVAIDVVSYAGTFFALLALFSKVGL